MILLDDFAARKEGLKLGLNVKGTLAVIRKLQQEKIIPNKSPDDLYQDLMAIQFRIKRSVFDQIFNS